VRNCWSLSVVSLVGDSLGVSVFIGVGFPVGVFDDVAIGISSSLESVSSLSALNRASRRCESNLLLVQHRDKRPGPHLSVSLLVYRLFRLRQQIKF